VPEPKSAALARRLLLRDNADLKSVVVEPRPRRARKGGPP
jgi:hypothetical protein